MQIQRRHRPSLWEEALDYGSSGQISQVGTMSGFRERFLQTFESYAYLQFENHFNLIFTRDSKKKELGAMGQT